MESSIREEHVGLWSWVIQSASFQRPNSVFLRCVDEPSPFDQEKSGGVAALSSDQVHAMAKDIVGQVMLINKILMHFMLWTCIDVVISYAPSKVLAGIDVDKADDIPLDNDKPLIVYEAAGADEVEVNW